MQDECRKCGSIPEPKPPRFNRGDYLCNPCHREYCKEGGYKGGKASPDWWKEYWKRYFSSPLNRKKRNDNMRRYRENPKTFFKHAARWKLNQAVRSGGLERKPCEVCGEAKTQGHHQDYNLPLDVNWLCRSCHRTLHAKAEGK